MNQPFSDEEKKTEQLFAGLSPLAPRPHIKEQLRSMTVHPKTHRRGKALLFSAAAAVIVACAAVGTLFFAPGEAEKQNGGKPASSAASSDAAINLTAENALVTLDSLQQDCEDIDEILEIVPDTQSKRKKEILEKLEQCMKRVSKLKEKVRYTLNRSEYHLQNAKEVHV